MNNRLIVNAIASFALMLAASVSFAQSFQTEVEILQEAIGLEKKVAVANFMQLDDADAGFWKLYDEYEVERKKLGQDRIKIIADYASSYEDISDDQILDLFQADQRRQAIIRQAAKNLL